MSSVNIGILGVGALACRFGVALSELQHTDVTLIGNWREQIEAIQQNGLSYKPTIGKFQNRLIKAEYYSNVSKKFDFLIVLVKSHQTRATAKKAVNFLAKSGVVITFQNGLGNDEILKEVFKNTSVFSGITSSGANLIEPGKVNFVGDGFTAIEDHSSLKKLYPILQQIPNFSIVNDIEKMKWKKLLINSVINPLTALNNLPNGKLTVDRSFINQIKNLVKEGVAVAKAEGFQFTINEIETAVLEAAAVTSANISSMLQDIRNGRKTEIDAINCEIVKRGTFFGIKVTENEKVVSEIKQLEESQKQLIVTDTIEKVRKVRWTDPYKTVGLVPTMGFLHEGHLSLVERAKLENDIVAVSIFVNPTQFNDAKDLETYPRDLEKDLQLLRNAGVDLVWTPTPEIMYPPLFQSTVTLNKVTQPLEGEKRPGHFDGVTTVVAKLFNVFQPTKAYFGQKDAQQVAVIKQMVADLNFNLELVICPIIRENDGLAKSSRNTRLSKRARASATCLYRALQMAQSLIDNGEVDVKKIYAKMTTIIEETPLTKIDYISIADAKTLKEVEQLNGEILISMAVFVGNIRLIDNLQIFIK